jgi:hypothetical protein
MMRHVSEALLVALALGQLVLGQRAHAQSSDPTVTSDSSEYCDVLMDKYTGLVRTASMPPPIAAAELSEEGKRMCVNGQVRGGVMRLRRALLMLRHGED